MSLSPMYRILQFTAFDSIVQYTLRVQSILFIVVACPIMETQCRITHQTRAPKKVIVA
jgi:hypothetical protein